MSKWVIDSGTLTDIADAVRAKTGGSSNIEVSDLATEIANIPQGTVEPIKLNATWKNDDSASAYGEIFLTANNADYNGNYDIMWADSNGALTDYVKIDTVTLDVDNGKTMGSIKLMEFNAIPTDATKIVAVKNNSVVASYDIPQYKQFDATVYGTVQNKKALFSDQHQGYETSTDDIQAMLEYADADNDIDAVCGAGDLTANGYTSELDAWLTNRDTYRGTKPVYCCGGNHEASTSNAIMTKNPTGLRKYLDTDWVDETENYFLKEIDDDIYIFISVFEGTTHSAKNTMLTTASLDWLETQLETYRNQRVFLFMHIPPLWSISGMKQNGQYIGFGNGNGAYTLDLWGTSGSDRTRFLNLLDHYKNVIWFSGHSHIKYQYQNVWDHLNVMQYKGGARFVHLSSLVVPRDIIDGSATGLIYAEGEFSVMEVYENAIRLKSYNLIEEKFYGLCEYIIDTTPVTIPSSSKTVVSISATKTKTSYYTDETLSTADITVTATFSDSTTSDVTSSAVFDTSNVDLTSEGTYTIGISYTYESDTVNTSVQVTATERPSVKTLSSISASKTTTTYTEGDTLSTADITVTATYSDTTTADVTASAVFTTSGVDMSTAGAYTIGVSYTEDGTTVTTSVGITVSSDTGGYTVLFDASWDGSIASAGGSLDGTYATAISEGITKSGSTLTAEPASSAQDKNLYYRVLADTGLSYSGKVGFGIGVGNTSSKWAKQGSPFYSFTSSSWQPIISNVNDEPLKLTSSHNLLSVQMKSSSSATATFPVTINARIQIGYSNT